MKSVIKITLAASLVASAAASHNHQHLHAKKHQADKVVEKRDPSVVTQYVAGPTETVYEIGGKVMDADEAKQGIDGGNFVVVGETTPTFSPPPPPPAPTTTSSTSTSADMGAQFLESKVTTTTKPTTTAEPTTSSTPPPPKTTTAASSGGSDSNTGGQGLDSKFESGKVPCSEFPSDYGAVPVDWLDMGGWSSIQFVPDFTSLSSTISTIIGGVVGDTCGKQAMCSYACPPGYQKTQWPKAQGSTKESIGGLFCNAQGFLELTREDSDTLCEKGVGGVSVQNDLDEEVVLCRTDYPGSEAMVIPAVAAPGGTVDVTNPDQDTYYQWDGLATSAQWYLNKKGYSKEQACVWNSAIDPLGAGNWSPDIIGVGKASDGITYISIFPNSPTSTAKLDFNVEIKGDVSSECSLINGKYSGGSNGCTVSGRVQK